MIVRLDIRTKNPLNGAQGQTVGARKARSAERTRLRRMAAEQTKMQTMAWNRKMSRSAPETRLGDGVNVTLTRIAPRPLDDDGWQAAAKPLRDGVADYFECADNDERISFEYGQRRGRVREHAVEILIEPRRMG